MSITAGLRRYEDVNEEINRRLKSDDKTAVREVNGQRYLGCGLDSGKSLDIYGTAGNDLACYLNGGRVTVYGSAQDAVGNTMGGGEIIIHGSTGDAAGYAMRGGRIYVKGDAGYRTGIHMKAYKDKIPVMVIGGCAGSFLGEYQAGGAIVVLGLGSDKKRIVGNFPCTGMHGGKMILRSDCADIQFPGQVTARPAAETDMEEIKKYIDQFCRLFGCDEKKMLDSPFTVVTPDSKNPYKQLYVAN